MRLKFIIITIILLSDMYHVAGQICKGGMPRSFTTGQLMLHKDEVIEKAKVDFYTEDLLEVDKWRAREGTPMPIAKLISVNYSFDNSGQSFLFPDGREMWRLHLKAENAIALMLYYKEFYIPPGGELFIYDKDTTKVLGSYTYETNPSGGIFATEFTGGDEVILEYYAPQESVEKPRISISDIGYGYNKSAFKEFIGITTKAASGSCMVNINCEEGDAWQDQKNGICYTIQKIGRLSYLCSASLLNNTAEDFKPLILMAAHCAYDDNMYMASSSDMGQWIFYFHKEYSGCANTSPVESKTMTGCKLLTNTGLNGGSDGLLVLLNSEIPADYNVFYNGWDSRNVPANSGVGIHHPSGDYMKISTFNKPAQDYDFIYSDFTGDKKGHWNVQFVATKNGHSVTEGGSSGSPLFNEKKLVVGTLTGGNSSCESEYELNGLNLYGKFSYHFNRYSDESARMDIWLDPLKSNVTELNGRYRTDYYPAPRNLSVEYQGNSVKMLWERPSGNIVPHHYRIYRNNVKIQETNALVYIDNEPSSGYVMYAVSAIYDNGFESAFIQQGVNVYRYNSPTDLKAERISATSSSILLTWKKPYYEQTIYWGSMDAAYIIGLDENIPFYYGQRWSKEDISMLDNKIIKAVNFIPIKGNSYQIFISQGSNYKYQQVVDDKKLKYKDVPDTVVLETPFVIDASRELYIAIYVSKVVTDYPAVCDEGTAVRGKGNLLSLNGVDWAELYQESNPDEFDMNFVVSALITSETGVKKDDFSGINTNSNTTKINIKPLKQKLKSSKEGSTAITVNSGSIPTAFPQEDQYIVYRQGSLLKKISSDSESFTDKTNVSFYYYEISSLYGNIESTKSNKAYITVQENETINDAVYITPTQFANYVQIKGSDLVSKVEIFTVTGKLCIVIDNPDNFIETSSLSNGLYFFRLYTTDGKYKTVKAIKSN